MGFGKLATNLGTASILHANAKYRAACLHSQQAVEKVENAFKTLFLEKGQRPPRTRDIVEFLNLVTAAGWASHVDMDEAVPPSSFYRGLTPTVRWPSPQSERIFSWSTAATWNSATQRAVSASRRRLSGIGSVKMF